MSELPKVPVVKRALRVLWRDEETLQLGVDRRHAVVLDGLGVGERVVFGLIDGRRDVDAIVEAAGERDIEAAVVHRLLAVLSRAGVLDEAAIQPALRSELDRQRLTPDMLSLSLVDRQPGAATRALSARAAATVSVHGLGRLGASVAMLLAAAGVGELLCVDDRPLAGPDLAPGGVRQLRAGSRASAVTEQVSVDVPTTRVPSPRMSTRARGESSLAIVAAGLLPLPEVVAAVRHAPHLFVLVRETRAIVGPLVIPGRTACWRCLHVARVERDPQWPVLAAQLALGRTAVEPADVTLTSLAASLAAMQALRWIDHDGADVETIDGQLEFDLADGRLRRRTVAAHPGCGCGAAADHAVMAVDDVAVSA